MEGSNGERFVTWRALMEKLHERDTQLREEFGRGTSEIVNRAFASLSLLAAIAAVVIAIAR